MPLSEQPPRVLVVGAGAAGTSAALAAREAGAWVTVVAQGQGATAFASGLAWPQPRRLNALGAGEALPVALDALVAVEPSARFVTASGELTHAALALPAQALGALKSGERVAVVGLRGAPHLFDAAWVADALRVAGISAEARMLALPLTVADLRRSPFEWARALDVPQELECFGDALARISVGVELCLLPPFLGLRGVGVEQLSARCGVRVGEVAATVPSVPGLRLAQALEAALVAAGCTLRWGRVAALTRAKALLEGGESLDFDAAVLASGRFLGGGVQRRAGAGFVEPLLGLPLFSNPATSEGARADRELLSPDTPIGVLAGNWPGQAAPAFALGVRVDAGLHPLDATGAAVPWLTAAGSVLAGAEGGLLAALRSGALAGSRAVADLERQGSADQRVAG